MKQNSTVYLTYALDKEGKLVHIDDVPNGYECGCFCPHCKKPLCAKNGGKIKTHHFAHLSGADCKSAVESALHIMAKEVLSKYKKIMLPPIPYKQTAQCLELTRIEPEKTSDCGLRPDCECYYGEESEKRIWIEFKRTHAVDQKKKGKIILANIDCVEIDLNSCEQDPDKVKQFLIEESTNRIWIYNKEHKYSDPEERKHNHKKHYYNQTKDYHNYCDPPILRRFAREDTGKIVNLKHIESIDLFNHNYYCLSCEEEVSIEMLNGEHSFVHINKSNDIKCRDELYLRNSAKAIIYDKFEKSDKFEIEIPHNHTCSQKDCPLFSETNCTRSKPKTHELKSKGYECKTDAQLPNQDKQTDLLLYRENKPKDSIIININSSNYHEISNDPSYRSIDISATNDEELFNLAQNPLSGSPHNFKPQRCISKLCIPIYRFKLYKSGKSYTDTISCNDIQGSLSRLKQDSVLSMVYFNGEDYYKREISKLGLYHCFNRNIKSCYCELCIYLKENNGINVCIRYKTKGTPHYPLSATPLPIDCPYFKLDLHLKSWIEKDNTYINRLAVYPVENLTNP